MTPVPRITNDVELAKARARMDVLAECGCHGGCRCPLPLEYHQLHSRVEEYRWESSTKVMARLRAFRDNPCNAYQDRAEILAELVQVIGWDKP